MKLNFIVWVGLGKRRRTCINCRTISKNVISCPTQCRAVQYGVTCTKTTCCLDDDKEMAERAKSQHICLRSPESNSLNLNPTASIDNVSYSPPFSLSPLSYSPPFSLSPVLISPFVSLSSVLFSPFLSFSCLILPLSLFLSCLNFSFCLFLYFSSDSMHNLTCERIPVHAWTLVP